ncbi:hypothetical protein Pcinc_032852 [Petrolisthes cinctipes]|uniref:WD repeat-containing protein 54 beta-propeller domain-containing protein n=1 Tax=Petrolisthes cinctipes TaxID=88211 RepID=A0AAE1ETF7_PETCI|nr:hypothetical protein Pcinc_032852 [Petrolisthes cinctipes]
MMYQREKLVVLKSSASLFPNNVSRVTVNGETYAGVVHKDQLNIVRPGTPEVEPRLVEAKVVTSTQSSLSIMQAAWVKVSSRTLLVLATTKGALFYDWDGSVLLYAHLLPPTPPDAPYAFTRGIAAIYSGFVCVGVHTGEVVVVRVSDEEVKTVDVVKWHARPITTLASHGLVLVTGDDEGHITVAQDDQGLQNVCCIDTYGSPVTCLAAWGGQVVAAYLSGHIRIFNLQCGRIIAEVCGHARSITGLDIAKESGLMLTTSEDSYIRVWQLNPSSSDLPVEHKYGTVEENVALCGGAFTDDVGSGFFTTGYDRRDIICYAM